tara:strand:- start:4 stop:822 length:819 start_codon:yes stop_codon:yes gene_type:complete
MLIPISAGAIGGFAPATWSLSGMSYDSKSGDVSVEVTSPQGLFFKSDGTKCYVICIGTDKIYQYSLSTAWDISTISYDSVSLDISARDTLGRPVRFSDDGSYLYFAGTTSDDVFQFTMSTAWDLSTATYTRVFDVSGATSAPLAEFNADGTKMYISDPIADDIEQYGLSTAWDISSASLDSKNFASGAETDNHFNIRVSPDGGVLLIVDLTNNNIEQFSLSTTDDISTASYDSVTGDASGQCSALTDIYVKADGSKLYALCQTNDAIYQYSL